MQMKISVMHNLRTYTVTLTYVSGTLIGFGEWNGLGWGIGSTSAVIYSAGIEDMKPFFCD